MAKIASEALVSSSAVVVARISAATEASANPTGGPEPSETLFSRNVFDVLCVRCGCVHRPSRPKCKRVHLISLCIYPVRKRGVVWPRAVAASAARHRLSNTPPPLACPIYRRFIARHVHLQHHMQGLFEFRRLSGEFSFGSIASWPAAAGRPPLFPHSAPRRPTATEGSTRGGGIRRESLLDLGLKWL
jgi:hypothetical protein